MPNVPGIDNEKNANCTCLWKRIVPVVIQGPSGSVGGTGTILHRRSKRAHPTITACISVYSANCVPSCLWEGTKGKSACCWVVEGTKRSIPLPFFFLAEKKKRSCMQFLISHKNMISAQMNEVKLLQKQHP